MPATQTCMVLNGSYILLYKTSVINFIMQVYDLGVIMDSRQSTEKGPLTSTDKEKLYGAVDAQEGFQPVRRSYRRFTRRNGQSISQLVIKY